MGLTLSWQRRKLVWRKCQVKNCQGRKFGGQIVWCGKCLADCFEEEMAGGMCRAVVHRRRRGDVYPDIHAGLQVLCVWVMI